MFLFNLILHPPNSVIHPSTILQLRLKIYVIIYTLTFILNISVMFWHKQCTYMYVCILYVYCSYMCNVHNVCMYIVCVLYIYVQCTYMYVCILYVYCSYMCNVHMYVCILYVYCSYMCNVHICMYVYCMCIVVICAMYIYVCMNIVCVL